MDEQAQQVFQTTDRIKELLDLAIQCGRQLQSPQTGYVHYYYGSQENEAQQTIPLLENVLFSLSLLRSRVVEQMTEAKELLNRLLIFQNKDPSTVWTGGFPVYLHDYPVCRDPSLAVRLLVPFYWILKRFGHVIGNELKNKIEQAAHRLFSYINERFQEKPLSYALAVKFAAAQVAFGRLWANAEWMAEGEAHLELLRLQPNDSWHSTQSLADLLIALQMIYPSILNSPWKPLWRFLSETWHWRSCQYVGPSVKESQRKEEPDSSIYDLFMGYFSGRLSSRAKLCRPYHLHASLIQPCEDALLDLSFPLLIKGDYKGNKWELKHEKDWACAILEKKEEWNAVLERVYTPFKYAWGDCLRAHALVCQGGNYSVVSYQADFDRIELTFELNPLVVLEDIDKQKEINFYLDIQEEGKIQVEGHSSTTFQLGEQVAIQSGERLVSIRLDLIEGEGQFLGHFIRGNRPSQTNLKGKDRFNAYDWRIFLRTIRRQEKCVLKATITIKSMG